MKNYHAYRSCIESCYRCAALCHHCASSCLQESDVKMMAGCIRLDMECAVLCQAAAQLMALGSDKVSEILQLCAAACVACAEECGKHDDVHCKECAAACRECAEMCSIMAA